MENNCLLFHSLPLRSYIHAYCWSTWVFSRSSWSNMTNICYVSTSSSLLWGRSICSVLSHFSVLFLLDTCTDCYMLHYKRQGQTCTFHLAQKVLWLVLDLVPVGVQSTDLNHAQGSLYVASCLAGLNGVTVATYRFIIKSLLFLQ